MTTENIAYLYQKSEIDSGCCPRVFRQTGANAIEYKLRLGQSFARKAEKLSTVTKLSNPH
jgi:hypothetical protein